MNVKEIVKKLQTQPFEPFKVVTSAGDRYEVKHPENLRVVRTGTLYIFEPVEGDELTVESPVIVGLHQVASLEPSPNSAA
ncbi:MAG: hypothetical protein AAF711_18565 [Planctomycetota bacterium]